MSLLRDSITGLVLFAATLGVSAAAQLELAPMSLEIGAGRNSELLFVTNRGTEDTTIQLRSFVWSQPNGEDKLDDTDDVVVSPPAFKLAPGKQQIVRVVLRGERAVHEASYRLILDQLPNGANDNTVHVAWRVSLPVFVDSGKPDAASLKFETVREPDGSVHVIATNQGGRHARLLGVSIHTANGHDTEPSKKLLGYVLPGARVTWPFPVDSLPPGVDASLRANGDTGPVDVHLPAPAAN